MKKILVIIGLIILALFVSACTNKEGLEREDFVYVTRNGTYDYEESLENHYWLDVTGSTRMLCSEVLSLRVISGGVLEIIDIEGDVYLLNDGWSLEFYDYYEEVVE